MSQDKILLLKCIQKFPFDLSTLNKIEIYHQGTCSKSQRLIWLIWKTFNNYWYLFFHRVVVSWVQLIHSQAVLHIFLMTVSSISCDDLTIQLSLWWAKKFSFVTEIEGRFKNSTFKFPSLIPVQFYVTKHVKISGSIDSSKKCWANHAGNHCEPA